MGEDLGMHRAPAIAACERQEEQPRFVRPRLQLGQANWRVTNLVSNELSRAESSDAFRSAAAESNSIMLRCNASTAPISLRSSDFQRSYWIAAGDPSA